MGGFRNGAAVLAAGACLFAGVALLLNPERASDGSDMALALRSVTCQADNTPDKKFQMMPECNQAVTGWKDQVRVQLVFTGVTQVDLHVNDVNLECSGHVIKAPDPPANVPMSCVYTFTQAGEHTAYIRLLKPNGDEVALTVIGIRVA